LRNQYLTKQKKTALLTTLISKMLDKQSSEYSPDDQPNETDEPDVVKGA